MALSFTEALQTEKRKARLAGRTITTAEVRGISEGYGGDAATKLARLRELELIKTGGEETRALEAKLHGERIASAEALAAEQLASEAEQRASTEKMEAGKLELATERLTAEKAAAKDAVEAQEKESQLDLAVAGATSLGTVGFEYGGVVGGVIGAVVGGIAGYFGYETCMIVSACTDPHSPEVEIVRMYKHSCLDETTLTGYYALSRYLIPAIERFGFVRRLVKKCLVDRLVDTGTWAFGLRDKPKYRTSRIVADTFLGFCYGWGAAIEKKMKQSEV